MKVFPGPCRGSILNVIETSTGARVGRQALIGDNARCPNRRVAHRTTPGVSRPSAGYKHRSRQPAEARRPAMAPSVTSRFDREPPRSSPMRSQCMRVGMPVTGTYPHESASRGSDDEARVWPAIDACRCMVAADLEGRSAAQRLLRRRQPVRPIRMGHRTPCLRPMLEPFVARRSLFGDRLRRGSPPDIVRSKLRLAPKRA